MDVLGTRLGRYDIRERIGKGGMAAVYKAWDTNLDRWVAVKVLHDYLADEKDFKARFEREAKVVASLSHPNIVQVYDFDVVERNGTPIYYMVMAYIAGASLRGVMEQKHDQGAKMTLSEIENVMRGICSALSYAHQRDMAHRDVTPGNILFNEQGQAVLADFGIARMVSATRLTQTGMTSGTPMYMSPEQGIGDGGDQRSDIYSLGVILFEMLTGKAPFEGDSAFAVIMKHVQEPVPAILGKDPSLVNMEAVVFRALAKKPDDRYQDGLDFLRDFEEAASNKIVTRVQDNSNRTVVLPATPKAPTRKLLIPAVSVIALLLLVGLGVLFQSTQNGKVAAPTLPLAVVPVKTRQLAPAMTGGPLAFIDKFSADEDRNKFSWPVTLNDPDIYRNIEKGAYQIRHTIQSAALTSIFNRRYEYPFRWQYDADLTISTQSQPETGAGIAFRYHSDEQYYVFAVNGMGQVSIWVRNNGSWTELRRQSMTWTDAKAVKPAGQSNHLTLVDQGKQLIGYVNGEKVIDITEEPVIADGNIGIYLASTSDATVKPLAEVSIANFAAQPYGTATSTPSATSVKPNVTTF